MLCSLFEFLGEPLVAILQIFRSHSTPERIASFYSFEENKNPRIVSFSYFKSLKELIVFLKEPAKNQRFSDQVFDFSCFLRTMVSLYNKPNSLNVLRTGR